MRAPLSRWGWFALLILSTRHSTALASEVLKMLNEEIALIANDEKQDWQVSDEVCIYHKDLEIACGRIVDAKSKQATVQITTYKEVATHKSLRKSNKNLFFIELAFSYRKVLPGDVVRAASDRRPAQITPTPTAAEIPIKNEVDSFPLSNVSIGLNYVFPTLHYQQMLTRHLASGLSPMLLNAPAGRGSLSAWGGYATVNYYWNASFRGLWYQGGVGFHFITAKVDGVTDDVFSLAVLSTLGWRWIWNNRLNFGLAAGAQYIPTTSSDKVSLGFSGFFPAVAFDIGIAF